MLFRWNRMGKGNRETVVHMGVGRGCAEKMVGPEWKEKGLFRPFVTNSP